MDLYHIACDALRLASRARIPRPPAGGSRYFFRGDTVHLGDGGRSTLWFLKPRRAGGYHVCLRLRWRWPRLERRPPVEIPARWVGRTASIGWTGRETHIAAVPGWLDVSLRVDDDLYEWRIGREER